MRLVGDIPHPDQELQIIGLLPLFIQLILYEKQRGKETHQGNSIQVAHTLSIVESRKGGPTRGCSRLSRREAPGVDGGGWERASAMLSLIMGVSGLNSRFLVCPWLDT
jgi:hypothetical protein